MADLVYDKEGNKIPSKEFLSMVIIMLRKSEAETGGSFVQWLESFEKTDEGLPVETYDDKSLRSAISKLLKETYPDEPRPLRREEWFDEDDIEELPDDLQDDDDPLPTVTKLDD